MEKNFKIKTLVSASLLLSGLALAGCSSSSGGGGATTPDGIYSGSITGGSASFNGDEEKAIIYNSRMMVLSNNSDGVSQLFDAQIVDPAVSLAGSGLRYSSSSLGLENIGYDGAYVADQTATIDFIQTSSGSSLPPGTINLTANTSLFSSGSSMSKINSNTWTGNFASGFDAVMTLSIDANGNIVTGSGDSGSSGVDCGFTGDISLIDSSINVYSVNLISDGGGLGCLMPVGSYAGLAWTEGDSDGTLVLMVADGNAGRAVVLTRN